MSEIQNFAARLADNAALHQEDIKHIELLLKIAKLGTSPEEIGQVLVSVSPGKSDWGKTATFITALHSKMNDIFFTWMVAAAFEHREINGEKK